MHKTLYHASLSPRRLELLRQLGLAPTVLPLRASEGRAEVDETPLSSEPSKAYVQRLAQMKLQAALRAQVGRRLPAWPIIAADTTVDIDGRILGKPEDAAAAADMLRACSGRTHRVLTAVGVAFMGRTEVAVNESMVGFKALSEAEIRAYTESGEPFDKAGGYGIQGRAAAFIDHLSGSFSGVMGLPLFETSELLGKLGFDIW